MTTLKDWPIEDLEYVPACPICESVSRSLLHAGLTDIAFGVAAGKWNLYRCADCASGYLDPRPTPASIGRAYADYYTHDAADHPIVRRKGRLRTLLHDMTNGYQNARYGLKRNPTLHFGRWLLPMLPPLRSAADAECRHLPALPPGGGRLLDVGCGNGGFLLLAKQAGWTVEGVDFDPEAVRIARARGLYVTQGSINALVDRKNYYDFITMSHVIEHVHAPSAMLQLTHEFLNATGSLWLETPNFESLGHLKFGRSWRGLEPPRHISLFSRNGLCGALKSAGFHDIQFKTHGIISTSVYVSSEKIKAIECGTNSAQVLVVLKSLLLEAQEIWAPDKSEYLTLVAKK